MFFDLPGVPFIEISLGGVPVFMVILFNAWGSRCSLLEVAPWGPGACFVAFTPMGPGGFAFEFTLISRLWPLVSFLEVKP